MSAPAAATPAASSAASDDEVPEFTGDMSREKTLQLWAAQGDEAMAMIIAGRVYPP